MWLPRDVFPPRFPVLFLAGGLVRPAKYGIIFAAIYELHFFGNFDS